MMRVACLLVGGPYRVIAVDGIDYLFEDHPQMGPMPINGRGNPRTLGPRHAFWTAVTRWYEEGRPVGPAGLRCVWTPEPEPMEGAVHIGGRHWVMAGSVNEEGVLGAVARASLARAPRRT